MQSEWQPMPRAGARAYTGFGSCASSGIQGRILVRGSGCKFPIVQCICVTNYLENCLPVDKSYCRNKQAYVFGPPSMRLHALFVVQCSATCGEGVELRNVTCPHEGLCNEDEKPLDKRLCDAGPCLQWVTDSWGQVRCYTHVDTFLQLQSVALPFIHNIVDFKLCLSVQKPVVGTFSNHDLLQFVYNSELIS